MFGYLVRVRLGTVNDRSCHHWKDYPVHALNQIIPIILSWISEGPISHEGMMEPSWAREPLWEGESQA